MKKIRLLLVILIAGLVTFGSVVIMYASAPRPVPSVVTSVRTSTPRVVAKHQSRSTAAVGPTEKANHRNEISLTFDDGPFPYYSRQILNILQQQQVHATFFCVGKEVQKYPEMVRQEVTAGNVVENHSWNHSNLIRLTSLQIYKQIVDTNAVIEQVTGSRPTLFRPPYGVTNIVVKMQAEQLQLTSVLWTIDTKDWQRPGVDSIVRQVLSNATNGSIVLMHDGGGDRSQTVAALPLIIKGLEQRGFILVTVPQLFSHL